MKVAYLDSDPRAHFGFSIYSIVRQTELCIHLLWRHNSNAILLGLPVGFAKRAKGSLQTCNRVVETHPLCCVASRAAKLRCPQVWQVWRVVLLLQVHITM